MPSLQDVVKQWLEDEYRKRLANEAMHQMEALYKKHWLPNTREQIKMTIEQSTDDDAMNRVLHLVIKQGLEKDDLDQFVASYMQRRNNTVALPSYQIPEDHEPSYTATFHPLPPTHDEEAEKDFFWDYEVRFTPEEFDIYERAAEAQSSKNYQEAHRLFGALMEKHEWFVRVSFNWIVTGLVMYSTDLYENAYLFANNYNVRKPKLRWTEQQRFDDAQEIKRLLQALKRLKKQFPTYEMRTKNRWLQTSHMHLAKYLEQQAYLRLFRKMKRLG